MPIYDYACSACGHVTEVVHGINDGGPKFCPECGAEGTMTKSFSTPAIHFKGSGWAKKDRGSSARATAKAKDDGTTVKEPTAKDSAATDAGTKESASASTGTSSADKGSSGRGATPTAAAPTSKPD